MNFLWLIIVLVVFYFLFIRYPKMEGYSGRGPTDTQFVEVPSHDPWWYKNNWLFYDPQRFTGIYSYLNYFPGYYRYPGFDYIKYNVGIAPYYGYQVYD